MKARVEHERMPHGADRTRQLKLGRGGLSDVEWLVQLIQLQHAHKVEGLRTTSTLEALDAALEAVARWSGYTPGSARQLEEDYLRVTRNARKVYERLFFEG